MLERKTLLLVVVFWLVLTNIAVVVVIMPNRLTPPKSLSDEYKRRLTPKPRFCERMKVVAIIFGLFCQLSIVPFQNGEITKLVVF
jgi:hypothetical protein